ncbi:ATP-dependent helicase [Mucilaginibacter hurinus]|uniref:ATP-dependent helicase n=1 Tax=Mucilaginibacter hurinus TaxID=2201324 RepID=A0A367GK63_9SPHI|nr:DEAD/DEAH box helicase [Mucilaginibacter hurinus]RCH53867.1 ATP-dependent helicase [Mucilaginibacter hurinus]
MSWPDKLKLKKQLVISLTEAGYPGPKEVQLKTLSRIAGGQDVIVVGPEGSGKTTTYVMAVLTRFNYNPDGVPRVLILVPDKDSVLAVAEQFSRLNRNKSISIVELYAAPGTETQMNALADGADIVIATPDRARALYLKLGLNLNKIELIIIDDADLVVKQGLQLPVAELANSAQKCQHLVFTEVMHNRLEKMIDPFMNLPAMVEVEQAGVAAMDTHPQVLYTLPNFGTKLNLLYLFMQDDEVFTRVVVFVNTRPTAEKIYQNLGKYLKDAVAILNPWFFEQTGFATIEEFKQSAVRLLIAVNDNDNYLDLDDIPFVIHFELPDEKETYIKRVTLEAPAASGDETLFLTFATDLELNAVKKIEQATGQKMQPADLPDDLVIDQGKKAAKQADNLPEKDTGTGEAFHQKKASNSKTYNYSSGEKAKMNKKRKHG